MEDDSRIDYPSATPSVDKEKGAGDAVDNFVGFFYRFDQWTQYDEVNVRFVSGLVHEASDPQFGILIWFQL